MNKLLGLSIIILFAFSCKKDKNEPTEDVMIRIENSSDFAYENILVEAFGEEYSFGDLNANQLTEYQSFSSAYRYAYIELEIDKQQYIIQPIDFFGEQELEGGFYTYIISADTSSEIYSRLNLILRAD